MNRDYRTLDELWEYVHELSKRKFPENSLAPIVGNGKTHKPKIMFIFINPTAKNISSAPTWRGPRFPFIGTKQIWRVFHKAGLFNSKLIRTINDNSNWSFKFTNQVLKFLQNKCLYLTNVVKLTGRDAALPDSEKIKLFLPILKKEIEIVHPEYIVTFGLMPFEKLTGQKIKLAKYYSGVMRNKKLNFYDVQINSIKARIIPCYFPVGRGNPKKAIRILKLVSSL